jgi:hypothetical protein
MSLCAAQGEQEGVKVPASRDVVQFDVELLGPPPHHVEGGVGAYVVSGHQHSFGLLDYRAVGDDNFQLFTDAPLDVFLQGFGDVNVEAPSGHDLV